MTELHFDLQQTRCPRCAGALVLRATVTESQDDVRIALDTACVACGVQPWQQSDERLLVFRPGESLDARPAGDDVAARLAAAHARIEQLLRRIAGLDGDLEAARRETARSEERGRARTSDLVAALRTDVTRLEGELADARAQLRRDEEAVRGKVEPGKRAIEVD